MDTASYENYLRYRGFIFIDAQRMEEMLKESIEKEAALQFLTLSNMCLGSGRKYAVLSKDTMLSFLIDECNLEEKYFINKNVKGFSLNASTVLEPLLTITNSYTREVIQGYIDYNSLKAKNSRIKKVLPTLQLEDNIKSADGANISKLYFSVNQQENLRYNYRKEDIISLSIDYKTCTVVPKGYILAWGDYAQSDWRIAYNLFVRDERNAQIMDMCEDKYEGIARVLADFYGEEFDPDAFREKRYLYKLYVLQTIYGTRSSKDEEANAFITKFYRYLETCPRYMKFCTNLENRFDDGSSIEITSYFNFKQIIPSNLNKRSAVNKGLNTPVQTGTSEIVILTVNEIMRKFKELGYTEEDVCVYFVRHDEPIFILRESVMKDSWVFADCSTINIDDWTPLKLSFDFGYRYGIPDKSLGLQYKIYSEANQSRFDGPSNNIEHFNYQPVAPELALAVSVMAFEDNILFTYFDYKDNRASYDVAPQSEFKSNEDMKNHIKETLLNYSIQARREGWGSMHVYCNFTEMDLSGVMRIYYDSNKIAMYNKAKYLSEIYIATQLGKALPNDSIYEEYKKIFVRADDLFSKNKPEKHC